MIGGVGQSVGLDDVVRVARGESTVVLDTAACERIKKESPPPAKGAPAAEKPAIAHEDSVPAADGAAALSTEDVRAALLARLLPLVNGRSKVTGVQAQPLQDACMHSHVLLMLAAKMRSSWEQWVRPCVHAVQIRLGAVQLLARWIASVHNFPPVEAAGADAEVLSQLADVAVRVAPPVSSDGGTALSSAEEAVLVGGLSSDERQSFLLGQPVTAGIGAVFVHDGQRLLAVAASVAALSAEALQAQVT